MTDTENGTKRLLITKEIGQRWAIDFEGDIRQRDMNQLRRALPVLFSRMKRAKRIKRQQAERAAAASVPEKVEPTDEPIKIVVEKRLTQFEINVAKSQKEVLDGRTV